MLVGELVRGGREEGRGWGRGRVQRDPKKDW